MIIHVTRTQIVDLYFKDARSKLIEIAAFLDRVQRAEGEDDFRMKVLRRAIHELTGDSPQKARSVLLALSDPTLEPISMHPMKSAIGAWNEENAA